MRLAKAGKAKAEQYVGDGEKLCMNAHLIDLDEESCFSFREYGPECFAGSPQVLSKLASILHEIGHL
jgi:hypothetical protein